MKEQLGAVNDWLESYQEVFDLSFLQDENIKTLPSGDVIETVGKILENLKNDIDKLVQQANESVTKAKAEYQRVQSKWDEKRGRVRDELNNAIARLPEQAGKSG